jgi:nitrogen-specific signal transduction histidine kinase/ActR/RegA family two-component response regulator
MAALRDSSGNVVGFIAMGMDITERKQLQAQMQEKQKLESVGLLAGGIAHDFNNLLVGILGNASLAMEMLPRAHPLRELIEPIQRSGERAADLVRQLLAYAGKGRFIVEPVHMSALVRDITSLVQSALPPKAQLQLDLADDLPIIESDRIQMQQLVMNLVLNAGEAIGDREGTVTVKTRAQVLDAGYVENVLPNSGVSPGRFVLLEVADTGSGMDAETKARIFDPFFTTKFTGCGLGLAAAQGIVRSHKGVIHVFSSPGLGSTFQILLPVLSAVEEPALLPAAPAHTAGEGTVLVVDDEEIVRNMARFALERSGYKVLLAPDGQSAVEIFRRNADDISVVLLDLKMPGMSGTEALKLMRRIRSDVKAVACTGYGEVDAVRLFADHRISAFLQKPFTAGKLAATIGGVLESRPEKIPEA